VKSSAAAVAIAARVALLVCIYMAPDSMIETIVPGVANYALRMRPPQARLHYIVRERPGQSEQVMNRTLARSITHNNCR
jgi:hypothetical protein